VTATGTASNTAGRAAQAVRSAAREALGRDVELAGPPEVGIDGGRGAYVCRLAGELPPPWNGELVVRVRPGGAADGADGVSGAAALRREATWHDLAAAGGVAVPRVLALEASDAAGDPALVTGGGRGRPLLQCMATNFGLIPELISLLGELHARIHAVPADTAAIAATSVASPFEELALDSALASTPAEGIAPQIESLRSGARGPGAPVVCHGDFQPSAVRVDPGDLGGAVVTNWSSARLAEREYDVALTILMFWSAPYLAPGRGQRKMLKTVREMLIEGYRASYERHAPLDGERLRYWGAFHALVWQARLAAPPPDDPDPWDPAALVTFPDAYRRDLGRRVARLTQPWR
jgi:aminoglycoside phosphotransferase (APT) family kinase protein